MGQLNIKDEALIAEARALAERLAPPPPMPCARRWTSGWRGSGPAARRSSSGEAGDHGGRASPAEACGGRVMSNAELRPDALRPRDGLTKVILDSSALIAIIEREEDADALSDILLATPTPRISAANWFEAAMVAEGRGGAAGALAFDDLVEAAGLQVEARLPEQARLARDAWRIWGSGTMWRA